MIERIDYARLISRMRGLFVTKTGYPTEHGLWTPGLSAGSSIFNVSGASGRYQRRGNTYRFQGRLVLAPAGHTLTADPLYITGLPYAGNSSTLYREPIQMWWNATATNYVLLQGQLGGAGAMQFGVVGITGAASGLAAQAANAVIMAGTVLVFSGEVFI